MTQGVWQGVGTARDLLLFGVSLAVRLAAWFWFVGSGVRPLVDEGGYFRIAGAWAEVLTSLTKLSLPTVSMLARACGDGRWPPLHPFILGIARAAAVDDLGAARLVGVISGAATTVVVERLTARLAGRPAASAAALLHALYPSLVFFSVALWSETLFILLLVVLLLVVVRAIDSTPERRSGWILSLGCVSALLLLTRAAALPMVVGLLAWIAMRLPRGRRLRPIAGASLLTLLLVLPWSIAISRLSGRPIFLSSWETLNLALGNNPWTPPALGSAWGVREFRRPVVDAARGGRAGEIALQEIVGHPMRTAQRIVVRAAQLSGLDFFPLRHLASATLPPLPAWTLPAGLVLQWLSLALLLFLAGSGICPPEPIRHRSLLLTLVAAGAAGPLATIAMPRLALPLLAVLVPAAGWGLTKLRQHSAPGPALLTTLAAGSLLLPVVTVRQVVEYHLVPSSHYAPALAPIAGAVRAAPLYTDVLACTPPAVADAWQRDAEPSEAARWLGDEWLPVGMRGAGDPIRYLAIAGSSIERPIALRSRTSADVVAVTAPERWQRFLPLAGTALTCAWEGAASDDARARLPTENEQDAHGR